jgi:iron complex transport system substrate-binding protein
VNDTGDGPAERVATLDFITTETVLLLGHHPVAVAGLKHYREWVGIGNDALSAARELGRRDAPDLETLAAAEPDLITGAAFRHQSLAPSLRRIAPVVLYNWLPEDDRVGPLAHLRGIVRHLAGRLDKQQRGEDILEVMEERLDEQAQRLAEAGWDGAPVVLAQHVRGSDQFNLYTDHSLGGAIANAIGLNNAWDGESQRFGAQTVGLRTLLALDDAHIILVAQPEDSAFQQMTSSPVWQSLPAVEADRIHRLPPRTWFFGGPRTIARLARQFTDALIPD